MFSKTSKLNRISFSPGKISGSSPSENKYYVLVMFDISKTKKYTLLTRILKRYCFHIQNSIYEAYLKSSDFKKLVKDIEKLMSSERFFNPDDRIRIYKVSGGCDAIIYGPYENNAPFYEENLFI